jgi:hypothetical protein
MNRGFEGGYGYGREVGHDKDRAENHGGSRVGCWNGDDVSGFGLPVYHHFTAGSTDLSVLDRLFDGICYAA